MATLFQIKKLKKLSYVLSLQYKQGFSAENERKTFLSFSFPFRFRTNNRNFLDFVSNVVEIVHPSLFDEKSSIVELLKLFKSNLIIIFAKIHIYSFIHSSDNFWAVISCQWIFRFEKKFQKCFFHRFLIWKTLGWNKKINKFFPFWN